MKSLISLLSVVLVVSVTSSAQRKDSDAQSNPPVATIDTIVISGNEKTKDYVILDEMTLKVGSLATSESIEFDRNRIYSLRLFTRVDIFCDTLQGQRFLFVDVSERWYIIPFPVFGFRNGDPKKAFYGGGLLHSNFRGRNQKLFGFIVFGYNPALALSFFDPLLDREGNLFFAARLSFTRVRNKSEIAAAETGDFDEKHYDINSTIGKRLSLYETVGLNLGYSIVGIDDYRPQRTVSPTGRDEYIYARLDYTYDSRDLREYPSGGQFFNASVTKLGFGESDVNFARWGVDYRRFVPLPLNLTFAGRVHGTIVSGGLIPTYNRVYFGFGERIRGYFKTVFEGENLFGTTLELRFPLIKTRTFHFTAIPLPEEFSVWRFGMSLAIFGDAGVAWFRGDALTFSSFASGYGGGIHFLLPYSAIMRLEYAYNEFFEGQFIIDFRASL